MVDQAAGIGQLNDDVTTTLVIQFSEPLAAAVDTNSVVIRDVDDNAYLSATSTLSSDTLTIVLAAALVAGNEIHVNLLVADFMDTGIPANHLAAGASVGFDSVIATDIGTAYLRLRLQAYQETNKDALSVSLVGTQKGVDTTGVNNIDLVQQRSNALNDVDDFTAGIQQLNSVDDDDGTGTTDTSERLTALATALALNAGVAGNTNVTTLSARLEFAPTNASFYVIDVTDVTGASVYAIIAANLLSGGAFGAADTFTADGSGDDFHLLLTNVIPGDVVQITPFDGFGYPGVTSTLVLVDNVAPTTTLQSSYATGNANTGEVVSLQYGQGGEQSGLGSALVGTPYFDLTPRLLGEVDGTWDGSQDDIDYVETFARLYEYNAVNPAGSNNANVPEGDQFIDEALNVYDTTAYADYVANYSFGRRLAVAFSENVTLTGTAPTYTAVTGTVVPATFVANADSYSDDDGDLVNQDLIHFNVSNVYNFMLQEDGGVLDFANAIADLTGNRATASTNAKVVMRNMFPPLVTSAVYSGRDFVVQFDQAIDLSEGPGLILYDQGGVPRVAIDLSDSSNYTLSNSNKTLTIDPAAWGSDVNIATTFDATAYNDVSGGALNQDPPNGQYGHTVLYFGAINNVNNVDWDFYQGLGAEGYFEEPLFAAVNTVADLDVQESHTATDDGVDTTVTVTYVSTHEIDMSNQDTNGNGVIDATEVDDMFAWSGGAIDPAGASLTITETADGGATYVFVVVLNGLTVVGDTLNVDPDGANRWRSDYDASQWVAAAGNQITF